MLVNTIAEFLDNLGITPCGVAKDCKLSKTTVYDLINNPNTIPGARVITKVCTFYKVQPGEFIKYIPEEE